jgi:hypothetical protein
MTFGKTDREVRLLQGPKTVELYKEKHENLDTTKVNN